MPKESLSTNLDQCAPDHPSKQPQLPLGEHRDGGAAAVVSAFYDALLAEDAPRALGLFAPEAWYEMPGGPYARPDGRPYQGAAQIAEGVL